MEQDIIDLADDLSLIVGPTVSEYELLNLAAKIIIAIAAAQQHLETKALLEDIKRGIGNIGVNG